jgi:very-short-patch-repair endonuclease
MSVESQFELLRKKLIDTSLRNGMLNFKLPKGHGVQVRGEDPVQVHRTLVTDGKKMSFHGEPDAAIAGPNGLLPLDNETTGSQSAPTNVDRTDLRLNTSHLRKDLDRRLLKTWRQSQELYEETGINVLYMTFGSLTWYEHESAAKPLIAPLVFVPVRLNRDELGRFKVEYDGGDMGDNLSLRVKLADDFGLKLPQFGDESTIDGYMVTVSAVCQAHGNWKVDPDAVTLSFFQFAKLVMYQDLDESLWPKSSPPTSHPDVQAMFLGNYSSAPKGPSEADHLDSVRPVGACAEIFDADSSQQLAILRALSGASMVIEGPPGTGKSQTIANLIAEFVAAGKKVLFVSEKMAALDVVYRRLDSAGLADACLELHSKASRRRQFYDELKRVMGLRADLRSAEAEESRLTDARNRLNAYSAAVNEPMPWGLTPHEAIGLASSVPGEPREDITYRVRFEDLRNLRSHDFVDRMEHVAAFQGLLRHSGVPDRHPYWGSSLDLVSPQLRTELETELDELSQRWPNALTLSRELAQSLHLGEPERVSDVAVYDSCVKRAVEAPPHDGVAVNLDTWQTEAGTVETCIADIERLQALKARLAPALTEGAWLADHEPVAEVLRRWSGRWWAPISGEYRNAIKTICGYFLNGRKLSSAEAAQFTVDIRAAQSAGARITIAEPTMQRLFGVQWQGVRSNPKVLKQLLEWCLKLRGDVASGLVPRGLLNFFAAAHDSAALVRQSQEAFAAVNDAIARLVTVAGKLQIPVPGIDSEPLAHVTRRVSDWSMNLSRLHEIVSINRHRAKLASSGLEAVADLACRWEGAAERLSDSVRRAYYQGIVAEAVGSRPPLREFSRIEHQGLIEQFRRVDGTVLQYNRAKARHAHLRGMPDWNAGVGNLGLLKRQCELRRGHKSIRWAVETSGAAIQQIKPVFLMSPLSVAQFLTPLAHFDVVIFDEASQIKPEDALSAILRADQTIVVGDTKQMPPTAFFDKLADDVDDDDDEVQTLRNFESILALMSATVRGSSRSSDLRWHYRSLHPALIRPSNAEFYRNRLVVFPSPVLYGAEGLKFNYSAADCYDRGRSRKNVPQARRVAAAVVRHMKERPAESLIVVAFSKQQEEAIEDELEVLYRDEPALLGNFNSRHLFERFDVKNLESVQGDERDVVFISVGYGPDDKGYTAMNFGPINSDGGDRRLNVLMSRARKRCEVFSSLRAADIRLGEFQSNGVAVLRKFLQFAETGELDDIQASDRDADSPFEEEVADALRQRGLTIDQQVGSLGFWIDLAVRHPDSPGTYIMGIECDGASYHSARTARDRDKLRQAALEARGWKLHRIWSTDWWQNREVEVERCISEVELALAAASAGSARLEEAVAPAPSEQLGFASDKLVDDFLVQAPEVPTLGRIPYRAWNRTVNWNGVSVQNALPQDMAQLVSEIVAAEGPIHTEVLVKRVREAAGAGRAGNLIRSAVLRGLDAAISGGSVIHDGEVVQTTGFQYQLIRDRSEMGPDEKRPSLVPAGEFAFVLQKVIADSYGVAGDDAVSASWRQLGFAKCTEQMQTIGRQVLEVLISEGAVEVDPASEHCFARGSRAER